MDNISKLLSEHHIVIAREVDDQLIGDCIFCGKENHFYMHKDKGLWDCKSCGSDGNINNLLYQLGMAYHKQLFNQTQITQLKKLSADRGLPVSALKEWFVGWDNIGKRYTIPCIVNKDSCADIRTYKLRMKTRSSAGAKVGLFNIHKIDSKHPVYLCEGEWDGMALDWLLKKIGVKASVVAVPGAIVFKKEWLPVFRNCDVQVIYDNDSPGEQGEMKVQQLLSGIAKSMNYIQWLSSLPIGFDLRDWIKYGIKVKKSPFTGNFPRFAGNFSIFRWVCH